MRKKIYISPKRVNFVCMLFIAQEVNFFSINDVNQGCGNFSKEREKEERREQ